MKKYPLVLMALLMFNCHPKRGTEEVLYPDTIDIELTHFVINEPRDTFKQKLVIKSIEDTVYYQYFEFIKGEDNFIVAYKFLNKDDESLELIDDDYLDYQIVDTLHITTDENIKLMKYELVNPPADSEGALLFNQKYGKMADINYGWVERDILTKWGEEEIGIETVSSLLSDSIARKTK
jgi:hypothetical protein